ncbi:cathepsin W-like [Anomaloglossus baeobatrachus]|uniref:cathepsin W-like n=1 Tax=Anomaloglossus baeobatrachus TaxID=238106 RepID=UPI003F4FC28D
MKVREYQYRLSVFTSNLKVASRLQREERGTAKYGVTKFSDLTDEEFTRNTLPYGDAFPSNNVKQLKVEATPVDDSCDWRKAGVISKAKDQGTKCYSCWAFAAVGNIEAQWGILGYPVNLSVQQVLDCGPCEAGCKGGYTWDAYITVMKLQGLVNETDYKYEGVTQKCRSFSRDYTKTFIYDFIMLPKNEQEMANYVKNNGTIAVAINIAPLKNYKEGVIDQKSCGPVADHAVLLVGYNQKDNPPHWILKNSWGEKWGENGFFKLSFGKNMCGVTSWPLSAVTTYPGSMSLPCPS